MNFTQDIPTPLIRKGAAKGQGEAALVNCSARCLFSLIGPIGYGLNISEAACFPLIFTMQRYTLFATGKDAWFKPFQTIEEFPAGT